MFETAKIDELTLYIITCPHCGYQVEEPSSGSLNWMGTDIKTAVEDAKLNLHDHGLIICNFCDGEVKLPADLLKKVYGV